MITYAAHDNGILVTGDENISLEKTFDCGQCFRFERKGGKVFTGVVTDRTHNSPHSPGVSRARRLTVRQVSATGIFIEDISEEEYLNIWRRFFSLDTDYNLIQEDIIERFGFDDTIKHAVRASDGIRLLRQDSWETLISFIISQNNNIPRIKGLIDRISRQYGERIDEDTYAFPTPEALFDAGIGGLTEMKTGFRAKYIFDAAERVKNGDTNLENIGGMSYSEAECELMKIKGVGKKVASCVLLFGYGFLSAFPVDVWIKRVIEKYYPNGLDINSLGKYAGIAQQYLFYYERYS